MTVANSKLHSCFWRGLVCLLAAFALAGAAYAQETMSFETTAGELEVTPLGHSSLRFDFNGLVIHVDPYGDVADYSREPEADLVLITHAHPDHYDEAALQEVVTDSTRLITNPDVASRYDNSEAVTVLENGDSVTEANDIEVQAVAAYNLVRGPQEGSRFHPRGQDNGYLVNFGGFRVYIAGDTECIPEMGDLGDVDLAFIPINLPYTMPPEEAVGCIKVISPDVVVPYHQGESDPEVVAEGLLDSGIEVRALRLP